MASTEFITSSPPGQYRPRIEKKCYHCKAYKDTGEFGNNRTKADGLSDECKFCKRERARTWRAANIERARREVRERYNRNKQKYHERQRANNKRQRRELRATAISNYSNDLNCCACCGESIYEFLSIDHIHN